MVMKKKGCPRLPGIGARKSLANRVTSTLPASYLSRKQEDGAVRPPEKRGV